MAGFKDIIGHEQIIEAFTERDGMDKVSHATSSMDRTNPEK